MTKIGVFFELQKIIELFLERHIYPLSIIQRQRNLSLTDLHFPIHQFRQVVTHHLVIVELMRIVLR